MYTCYFVLYWCTSGYPPSYLCYVCASHHKYRLLCECVCECCVHVFLIILPKKSRRNSRNKTKIKTFTLLFFLSLSIGRFLFRIIVNNDLLYSPDPVISNTYGMHCYRGPGAYRIYIIYIYKNIFVWCTACSERK